MKVKKMRKRPKESEVHVVLLYRQNLNRVSGKSLWARRWSMSTCMQEWINTTWPKLCVYKPKRAYHDGVCVLNTKS